MSKEHDDQMQQMRDMLDGAINQRNAAQNESIQLRATALAAQRELAVARERIAELEAQLANGHAKEE